MPIIAEKLARPTQTAYARYMPSSLPAPQRIRVFVDTFREGLLARVGHDLRLEFPEASVEFDGATNSFVATIHLGNLRVLGARVRGQTLAEKLSSDDREKIARAATREVFACHTYPTAVYRASLTSVEASSYVAQGELTLHGQIRPLKVTIGKVDNCYRASVALIPSEFGISPYRALAGALKVRDLVEISVSIEVEPS